MEAPEKTEAEQQAEVLKHLGDRHWRLNNLYYIKDKDSKSVIFKMNWAQEEQYWGMHYNNIDLKARQLGMTTFWCLFGLDMILFRENVDVGIIAHRREDSEAFFKGKIQYAYNKLPAWLKAERWPKKNEDGWLILSHQEDGESSIRVSTSMRSGTPHFLHISEFGKICAEYPDKAREIVTGAQEAVPSGGIITWESTAEGASGYFFNYCMKALDLQEQGATLTDMDKKLFFFPWWKETRYRLNEAQVQHVVIEKRLLDYFGQLVVEHEIELEPAQKAWYAKKLENMEAGDDDDGGNWDDMKREYPSFPREAFEQTVQGAYYTTEFIRINKEKRICKVPHQSGVQVDTWWDLGVGDSTCIWFTQNIGRAIHVIDFYSNSGEGLAHYKNMLVKRSDNVGYVYGKHTAPHDIVQREMSTGKSRWEAALELGLEFEIAPKLSVEDGIEQCRQKLSLVWFDDTKTIDGVRALKAYKKSRDAKKKVWANKPLHNWASHPSDAFRTMAVSHTFERDIDFADMQIDDISSEAWS